MSVSVPTWVTPQTAVPQAAPVVTDVDALAADVLPWASRATIAYEYAVARGQPAVDERRARGACPSRCRPRCRRAGPRSVRTPTLSVDAAQVSVTVVPDTAAVGLPGAVGACVSAWHCGTVIVTVVLACDTLPAASRALTYRPHTAPATTGRLVDSVLPLTDVISWPSW